MGGTLALAGNYIANFCQSHKTRADDQFGWPLKQSSCEIIQPPRVAIDRPIQVVGFCFAALTIPMLQIQNLKRIPMAFHFACLTLVLCYAAMCASVHMPQDRVALLVWLDTAGIFFATTTFFLAMSMFSPRPFKLVYWIIYALLLFGIFTSYYY